MLGSVARLAEIDDDLPLSQLVRQTGRDEFLVGHVRPLDE